MNFSHDHSCQFKNENDKSSVCVFDNCNSKLGDLIQSMTEFDEAVPYDLRQ